MNRKTTLTVIFVLSLVFIYSCKKSEQPSGGTWTFQGIDYIATSSYTTLGSFLTATTLSTKDSATFGTLQVEFDGTSLPTSSGTYTVVNTYPTALNEVCIVLTTNGITPKTYRSTGASGTLTVNVNVRGHTITASGSGIEMQNVNNASDSSSLIFTL